MPNELHLFKLNPSFKHWVVVLGVAGFMVFTGALILALQILTSSTAIIVICLGMALTVWPSLKTANTEYIVTNLRVLSRTGLLLKKERSVLLSDVEDIHVEWGPCGRFLDVATLRIDGGSDPFDLVGVEEPEKIRSKILSLR